MEPIRIFIGYDPREAATYHVLAQSIIEKSSIPVAMIPLHTPMLNNFDGQQDGTNAFIYSRFLVPELTDFRGWAIYCDSDMLFREDPAELWGLRDESKAVMVCPHDYQTKVNRKAIGTALEGPNESYPKKNQSSMVLWNCEHPRNRVLTREFVASAGGKTLHRFEWLGGELIGSIPLEWNWLVGEYPFNPNVKLAHFTLGAPGFHYYRNCDYSHEWHKVQDDALHMADLSEHSWRVYGRGV